MAKDDKKPPFPVKDEGEVKDTKKPFPPKETGKEEEEEKSVPPKKAAAPKKTGGGDSKGVEIKDKVTVNFDPVFNEKKVKDDKDRVDSDDDENIEEEFTPDVAFILEYDFNDVDDDEITAILEEYKSEASDLYEVLSVSQRIQRRSVMRRYRSRIAISRKRSLRRRASTTKIQQRAKRSAINNMKRRFSTQKKGPMSYAERGRVERIVAQRKGAITNQTRKLVRVKRQQERVRLSRRR